MFQDNLKALRKEKGITQEELAARLNVVRQTVSKWEKGLSVPDSDLLIKLAEILDVPVSRLLASKIEAETKPDALAEQLSRINEQLAIKNRRAKRVWKVFAFIIGGIIVMYILGIIAFTSLTAHPAQSKPLLERKQILKNLNRLCSNHLPKNVKTSRTMRPGNARCGMFILLRGFCQMRTPGG